MFKFESANAPTAATSCALTHGPAHVQWHWCPLFPSRSSVLQTSTLALVCPIPTHFIYHTPHTRSPDPCGLRFVIIFHPGTRCATCVDRKLLAIALHCLHLPRSFLPESSSREQALSGACLPPQTGLLSGRIEGRRETRGERIEEVPVVLRSLTTSYTKSRPSLNSTEFHSDICVSANGTYIGESRQMENHGDGDYVCVSGGNRPTATHLTDASLAQHSAAPETLPGLKPTPTTYAGPFVQDPQPASGVWHSEAGTKIIKYSQYNDDVMSLAVRFGFLSNPNADRSPVSDFALHTKPTPLETADPPRFFSFRLSGY